MKIETLCIHQKSLVVYPQLVTLLQTAEVVQSSSYIRLKSLRRCSQPRHRALNFSAYNSQLTEIEMSRLGMTIQTF